MLLNDSLVMFKVDKLILEDKVERKINRVRPKGKCMEDRMGGGRISGE